MSNKFTHIVIQPLQYITSDDKKMLAYYDEAIRQEKIARAAPELLEALKSCSPPHPACGETVGDCFKAGKCGCSLGAAIQKAEGKV